MNRNASLAMVPGLVLALALTAGCKVCSPDRFAGLLEDAEVGDEIQLGACEIEGEFVVPAGVIIEGEGAGETILISVGRSDPVLWIQAGAAPTLVRGIDIRSDTSFGILADGRDAAGNITLEAINITATRGVGLGAVGMANLTASGVNITGPVTAANASDYPANPAPGDAATHGVVLQDVDGVTFTNVSASGFAAFGALFLRSSVDWQGGSLSGNLATGFAVDEGSVTLTAVDLSDTYRGSLTTPSFAGLIIGGSDVITSGLTVERNADFGLFHSDVSGDHTDLVAADNGHVGLWVQRTESFSVSGTSVFSNNLSAGMVFHDSTGTTLSGVVVSDTVLNPAMGAGGLADFGDGIELIGAANAILLDNVTLTGNDRVGLLVDAEGGLFDGVVLTNVTVDGTSAELGLVSQGGTPPGGWDGGVTHMGATAANDAAFSGTLEILEIIGPNSLPLLADLVFP